MKVAHLTAAVGHSGGGMASVVNCLSQNLCESGLSAVEIFSAQKVHGEKEGMPGGAVKTRAFPLQGPSTFGFGRGLWTSLRSAQLDLFHVHGLWSYCSIAAIRRHRMGTPYITSPHGMLDRWAMQRSRWKKKLAKWCFEDAHLRGAACLHALCDAEAQSIRATGLDNPICVIPNGVDLLDPCGEVPASWSNRIPSDSKVLLYLGRIHPKKGLSNLIAAWNDIERTKESWHLVIAGWDQGGHAEELKQQVHQLGIHSVHFVGSLFGHKKSAAFAHADAFVLPSFSEGLPVAVLEAWSYGLPVLMTPQCNIPEGFTSGAALQIELNQPSIAAGLNQLKSLSCDQRRGIGERGRQLVKQRFAWKNIACDMRKVYDWVLGGGPMPDCVTT